MAACAVEEAAELTLFRRLTRWEGLVADKEIEWECCLEELGACLEKLPETGREVGCSFVERQGQHGRRVKEQGIWVLDTHFGGSHGELIA